MTAKITLKNKTKKEISFNQQNKSIFFIVKKREVIKKKKKKKIELWVGGVLWGKVEICKSNSNS